MRTTTTLVLAITGVTANAAVVVVLATMLGLLCAGIVLPAVWSASPARRRAARDLVRLLLGPLRQSRRRRKA